MSRHTERWGGLEVARDEKGPGKCMARTGGGHWGGSRFNAVEG